MIVRIERPDDAAAIRQVNELAFRQRDEADLIDRLRESGTDRVSLVAEQDGLVVGHILFTPVVIEAAAQSVSGMGLGPMAVRPDRQRLGIGSLLVRSGLQYLRDRQCPFIVVVGHSAYYPRFGFERASRHHVTCPWAGVPDEAFMILILDAAMVVPFPCTAIYRPEFGVAV